MKKIYAIAATYLEEFIQLEAKQEEALVNKEAYASINRDDDDHDDRPYQVINGVALYSIAGKMMASGNFWTRWMGIPNYEDISDVLAQMSEDEEVKRPLISMNTPGGMMAGLSDISDSWRKLNELKPVTVHVSGFLGSAGVWLASNSDKIYASEVAEVGSVGALIQHVSYQESLKKQGVKVTEVKSSPKKAIGSQAKDLSESDIAYLQKKVDEGDALFRKQLYRTRPLILEDAFTGEMFSATESLRFGLIDDISTFSSVFEKLSASSDGASQTNTFTQGDVMKRRVTAQMAEAAIKLGANREGLEIVSQEEFDTLLTAGTIDATGLAIVAGEGEGSQASGEGEGSQASGEGEGSQASGEGEGEVNPEMEALTAQVAALSTELGTATAEVETLTAQVTDLTTQLAAAASDPLRLIAEDRIKTMRIALGLTSIEMTDFSVVSLLAEHKALEVQFNKAFQAGGHTVPKKEGTKPEKKAGKVTNLEDARHRAVGI